MLTKEKFKILLEGVKSNGEPLSQISIKLNQLIDELINVSRENLPSLDNLENSNLNRILDSLKSELVDLFYNNNDQGDFRQKKSLEDTNKLPQRIIEQIQNVFNCLSRSDVRSFIKNTLINQAVSVSQKGKILIGFNKIYDRMLESLQVNLDLYVKLMKLNQFNQDISKIHGDLNIIFKDSLNANYLNNNIETLLAQINKLPEYSASHWDMTYPQASKTNMYIKLFNELLVKGNIANIKPATKQMINKLALFKNGSVDNKNINKFFNECNAFKTTLLQSIRSDYLNKTNYVELFSLNIIETSSDKIEIMTELYNFIKKHSLSLDNKEMSRFTVSPFEFLQKVVNAIAITADLICATSLANKIDTGRSLVLLNKLFDKTMELMKKYNFTADPKLIQQAKEFQAYAFSTPPLPFAEKNEDKQIQSTLTPEAA
ncbi:hypothetical protein L3V83_05720 [Thiotrichales bacterium 19X7-9]|nr:hypothetical protein [Thiotrichales bacterium 19X7-9]